MESSHAPPSPGLAPALRAHQRGVSDLPQPRVSRPHRRLVRGVESHRHEARAPRGPGGERCARPAPAPRRASTPDLDSSPETLTWSITASTRPASAARPGEPLRERERVHGLDAIGVRDGVAGLVALQGPDEVNPDPGGACHRGLCHELLDAVLADEPRAGRAHGSDRLGVAGLRRDQDARARTGAPARHLGRPHARRHLGKPRRVPLDRVLARHSRLAMDAVEAPVTATRSAGARPMSSPRRPPLTYTDSKPSAEASTTVLRRLFWPMGEMPPTT